MIQCILLDELALNDVLIKLENGLVQNVVVLGCQSLHLLRHDVVA